MSRPDLFPKPSAAGIIEDPDSQQRIIPESRRADGSIRKERKVKPGFTPAEDVGKYRVRAVLGLEGRRAAVPGSGSLGSSSSTSSAGEGRSSGPGYARPSTSTPSSRMGTPGRADAATSWRTAPSGSSSGSNASSPSKPVRKQSSDAPDAWDDDVPSPPRRSAPAPRQRMAARGGVLAAAAAAAASVSSSPSKAGSKPLPSEASQAADQENEAATEKETDPAKRAKALSKKLRAAEALKDKETAGETLLPEQKAKVDAIEAMTKELEGLNVASTGKE